MELNEVLTHNTELKDMNINLVDSYLWRSYGICERKPLFSRAHILMSYAYHDEYMERVIIPTAKSFMLDSGAFTFMAGGKLPDWDAYVKEYADFIVRNHLEQFFELDIDRFVGYDRVKDLRAELRDLTGRDPIPVWHRSRGRDEFGQMCQAYDYVAIGGIVANEIRKTDYGCLPPLIEAAHRAGASIHGLGFTNLQWLPKCHFDSVDSSSWTSGNRFGHLWRFDGRTMTKIDRPDGSKVRPRETAVHNFLEWVKFSEWAETHL